MKNFYAIHSGVQHIIQPVMALDELGILEKLFTSLIITNPKYLSFFKFNKKLEKLISLRTVSKISNDVIINYPLYEFIEIIIKLTFGKNKFTVNTVPHWRDQKFAQAISKKINPNCTGIMGFPNNLLESFEKCSASTLKVIEQPIGYIRAANLILGEEKELSPECADSLTYSDNRKEYLNRIDAELALADIICVPSEFVKSTFVNHSIPEDKIRVNPYGSFILPASEFKINKDEPLILLFVGQLSQRKGLKYVLEAIKILKKTGLNIYFILVGEIFGEGKWLNKYLEYIDERHTSIARHKLKNIYSRADLFLLPSLFEGSALVVYEALGHGIPCIVTFNTGTDIVINNKNGFVIPIRNADIIADKISLLDTDRELLHYMKNECLKLAEKLSWRHYRQRFKKIVLDALHANK